MVTILKSLSVLAHLCRGLIGLLAYLNSFALDEILYIVVSESVGYIVRQ
jgi:hypothetical protein